MSVFGQNKQDAPKPENLGKAVNSQYEETVPVITPDGTTLYFARKNHPQNNYGGEGSVDTWFSTYNPERNIWSYARRLGNDFNRRKFNSIESISPDGNMALIRGAYDGKNFKEEGFSFCSKEGNNWGEPKALDIKNLSKMVKGVYSGAFLSNDGRVLLLYFSEKKDDLASDLYVSLLENDATWSEPKSLGAKINTEYGEASPYLAADGKTLYFASDRPGGLGGYDIYKTEKLDNSWTNWSPPQNMGEPINTPGFDAYYSVSASGEFAYLISTNKSYGKNDIVRVKLEDFQKPSPVVLMTGQVLDSENGQPIRATINFVSVPDASASTTVNSSPVDGTYKMTLPYGNRYRIEATAPGYQPLTLEVNLSEPKDYEEMGRDLVMRPTEPAVVAVDPNANGNNNGDNNGDKQGNNGESVDLEAFVNNAADPYDPNAGGVGGMQELDPFADSEARSDELFIYDSSTRISSLYFDTGKVRVKSDSKDELDRVVELMKANGNLMLLVQGHTDNVGGRRFNQDLSEYRARMVRAYMIANGVAPFRLVFVGFGMDHPAESNATETGRTLNRRVEFHMLSDK